MTDPRESPQDRLLELLADRAAFGLSDDEQAELDALLPAFPAADRDALDRVAANLVRSYLPDALEPVPAHLSARVLAAANVPASTTPPRPARGRTWRVAAGLALAASLLIAVGAWWVNRPGRPPTAAGQREELLARAGRPGSAVVRLEWTATADPAARGATGDVVWDGETQSGYMLFRGLAANDPTREQYQLWVFDAARDERYPVDGGVFDVPAGGGDVVVPIRAKLGVSRPTLFAITVEPPGGVVVSSRERLPLLAKVPPNAG